MKMLCGHCGYKTIFELCGEYTDEGEEYKEDENSFERYPYLNYWYKFTWQLFKCPNCSKPTLRETYNDSNREEQTYEIIYPVVKEGLANLPEQIASSYQAALRVQHIEPSAFAVLIGRTLEAVCNYEKATGKDLNDKVNNLFSLNRIPKTLAEMAHQLRQIRNLGAHDKEDEVTEEDVPIMRDFVEAILEYLYVAPAKIEAVRTRLTKTT